MAKDYYLVYYYFRYSSLFLYWGESEDNAQRDGTDISEECMDVEVASIFLHSGLHS